MTMGATLGSSFGGGFAATMGGMGAGGGLGPFAMPRIPGMQPMAWSPMLQTAVQLPREFADGTPEAMCSLYCQIVECLEELSREKELRTSLTTEAISCAHQSVYTL